MGGKYEKTEGLWTFKEELPLLHAALSFSASNVQPHDREV